MRVTTISQPAPGTWQGETRLVRAEDGRHFVISGVNALFSGWEVLVFPADEEGVVADFGEVAGGRGMTFAEAQADLEAWLDADGEDA